MRIDLSCPAEVVRTELIPEENLIRLILMDLSDRGIDSCEATVRLLDREGEETGRTVHRARALKGRPHTTFTMHVPAEIPEKTIRAEAVLDKVWYEDNDVWRRDPVREEEYETNLLPPGNDLNALRYVAGDGAVGFPSQQARVWICVCGRPNANSEMICSRCLRGKEMIFQHYQRGAVLRQVSQRERQLDLQTRGAREETAQMQRIREAEYERKIFAGKRRKRLLAAFLSCLALTAALLFGAEPGLRLWSADTALREERLEDAREILASLGRFPGAESRMEETVIRTARRDGEIMAKEDTGFSREQMEETAGILREKGDGEADLLLADRVDLAAAGMILRDGELDEAEARLNALPRTTEGWEQLSRNLVLARGEKALKDKQYEEARAIFLSLENDPEASEKADEALYAGGLARMESGEYDTAVRFFSELGDYLDSKTLISQCWYLKGFTLENQGETEEARQAYLKAGNYEDARERAMLIRWNQAEAYLAAEDYISALPVYREMDGYEDARDKWIQCATEVARQAYRQKEYMLAASYLEDLPENTRETAQIRTRAYYLGARAAADRGELAEAITTMERVSTYGDAEKYIRNWRLAIAEQKIEEEKYEEAREVLAPLGDYYQAQKLLKEIEKKLASEE